MSTEKLAQLEELIEFNKANCPAKSGIYGIYNKVTKKLYIGKSKNMRARMFYHRNRLENNVHPNKEMQKEYNQYYKSHPGCWVGCLLQEIPMDQIDKAERYYIEYFDTANSKYGFNTQLPKKNQD